MKTFLSGAGALLSLASCLNALTYTNVSEVPLYGQSPPVYPTRQHVHDTVQSDNANVP